MRDTVRRFCEDQIRPHVAQWYEEAALPAKGAAPLFLAAGAVATSVLNARGRFGAAALAPIVYNLAIIVGALLLVPPFGMAGLAIGVVLGAAGHLLVQLPVMRRIGARLRPRVELGDAEARQGARADGAAGARPRGDPGRVPGDDEPRVDARAPARSPSSTSRSRCSRSRSASSACRWASSCCRRSSREAALGRRGRVPAPARPGAAMLAYVMIAIAALGIVVAEDVVRLLFGYGAIGEPAARRDRRGARRCSCSA